MKFSIILSIFFELLAKRRLTAKYLSEKHEISPRTVYRYVELLAEHIPLFIKRGRNGGICLADNYKLPAGYMTETEYAATIEALAFTYAQRPDEKFLLAKRKLSAQCKEDKKTLLFFSDVGNFFADSGVWGDAHAFSEKLRLIEENIKKRLLLQIGYQAETGEKSQRKIEPHALIYKQNVWYLYAFCHESRKFETLRLGGVFSIELTQAVFRKRPFSREHIPLFQAPQPPLVSVRLAFSPECYLAAQNWLGVENLKKKHGLWIADLVVPDDEALPYKILSFGAGVKVLEPIALQEKIVAAVKALAAQYDQTK
ncbi:MAG: WYL domain-containing protein [Clostridia bacterium]|nr:WYL domain-containing protein [Clostridia bacterium]